MHIKTKNLSAFECTEVSKNVQLLDGLEQQQNSPTNKLLQPRRDVFDRARLIQNTAILLVARNSIKPAPAPEYKSLPSFERLIELFKVDFEVGKLYCKKARGGLRVGDECGTLSHGYVQVYADHTPYRAHRLIWKMHHGIDPIGVIDHRDGNSKNNAIHNLRDVSQLVNTQNRTGPAQSNSGVRGVSWCSRSKRWLACIGLANKTQHLGNYRFKECAIAARQHAENIIFADAKGGAKCV